MFHQRELLLLVHRQHARRYREPAEDVDAGQHHRSSPSHLASDPPPPSDQRADHDHRGNRVGHRHQRRVQRRRDRPDHVIADEAGQHEDG